SVLHSFGTGNVHDGKYPNGGMVMDASGNLYGTTAIGGTEHFGTVFKITPSGVESVLHSFGTVHGTVFPHGGMVMDASGNLYGTTVFGGTANKGTVFKITGSGVESVLHSFGTGNVHDGKYPNGGMVMDARGNLYGTTVFGGTNNLGTVFKITPSGVESVLHSFGTVHGTVFPHGGMVMDASGNLYGTTVFGGTNNLGTVFKITPSGVESTFYSFGGNDGNDGNDGDQPNGGLVMAASGNLYGTTVFGGTNNLGTVFTITPSGAESTFYSFGGNDGNDGNDGDQPNGGLVMAASGNLYGTTIGGGTDNLGTVFKITPSGVESVLYSFGGGYDGSSSPNGGLVMDVSGNLYGTADGGGKLGIIGYLTVYLSRILGTPSSLSGGLGTVFKITPSGVESVLHSFGTGNVWQDPNGGMVMAASGNLYGTTIGGGTDNLGTVFKITPSGVESEGRSVGAGSVWQDPNSGMVMAASGNLYGTTSLGGTDHSGTVFRITP
ncbi:choice-of-anchor tandem repeat GloVer-containing protein, partial [Acidithiobacillus ferriphilus]|uniref:choice-of-anchor tandem repeat GloVer-containing protein n=1 Tax=Acidithiobacillus ferriphilus TaxID=1689834 RepID=UPI002DBBE8CB